MRDLVTFTGRDLQDFLTFSLILNEDSEPILQEDGYALLLESSAEYGARLLKEEG